MKLRERVGNQLVKWREDASNQGRAVVVKDASNAGTLSPVGSWMGGFWPRILESFAGAWQQNITVDQTLVTAYWAIFSCVTLIQKDIAKNAVYVMERKDNGISVKTRDRPILQAPNHFQTSLEFFSYWVNSLLLHGNTYVLKRRDPKTGFVDAMYILHPYSVTPLVAPDGSIYYGLGPDNLSDLQKSIVVPASEIIHDRLYTLHHPLIGVSPIYACGVAAMQGLAIQDNSAKFFQNMSRPSGVLTAPGSISNDVATRLKTAWETNFTGSNIGKVAVLGDGLKYEAMTVNAHDAQLIEQLKMTAEMVCACFHVPGYKIGVGPMPTVNNTAALNQQYYDQCLQPIFENMELRLNEGLELREPKFTEFDLRSLLRMDPMTRYDAHIKAIGGSLMSPDEARREENLPPVKGGNTVYMQSQNHALEALAKRDSDAIAGKVNVQEEAMNGAQVSSLQGLLLAASTGQLPPAAAKAAILAAFPLLEASEVDAMITPIEAAPTKPKPTGPAEPTEGADPEEDDEEMDGEKLLAALYEKSPEAYCHA